ncbi:hypothetical protein NTHI1209_01338 [Haemophilus influenzae]|uniref:Uncharacterized protein n=1 Tax=Haemophilus influenzae TaxID=727 RepID=A0A158SXY6_HAEIF|nr:hypothetical protein NTHI1209_01338 [Haemophilus influenzae]
MKFFKKALIIYIYIYNGRVFYFFLGKQSLLFIKALAF